MKNTEFAYTVTATAEWRLDNNGRQCNAVISGTAATLAAAKRKARADALDFQSLAVITYIDNTGRLVYSERNWYGLRGDWKPLICPPQKNQTTMKNKITIDQFRELEALASAYNCERENDVDFDYILAMLTTEFGDGPEPEETAVMVTLQAHDWDGDTDFGTIRSMLESVGVEIVEREMIDGYEVGRLQNADEWTPQSYLCTGDCAYNGKMCNTFAYCLLLEK